MKIIESYEKNYSHSFLYTKITKDKRDYLFDYNDILFEKFGDIEHFDAEFFLLKLKPDR